MQEMQNNIVEKTMKDRYLTFKIASEEYGLELAFVKEIIEMQPITKVPDMPSYIEGILNLRGNLIGVIDVRKRFSIPSKEHDEETCIIVIITEEYNLGIIVDAVYETVTIDSNNITAPPSAKLNYYNQFIRNIGTITNAQGESDVKLLIDMDKFLQQDVI